LTTESTQAVIASGLLTTAESARYVLSAGAESVAAVFALIVTVTFVVSQAGRYRIPAVLLVRISARDAIFYFLALAGIVGPLVLLYFELWRWTGLGLLLVAAAVAASIPFTQSRHRVTDPIHHQASASRHPDEVREVAMQALETGDYDVFFALMEALADAKIQSISTMSAFNLLGVGMPSESYAMGVALPWILLSPRFPKSTPAAVEAVAQSVMSACSPQHQGFPRPTRFMLREDKSDFARSNPHYSLKHLEAFSDLDIGFGALGYGLMETLLPGQFQRVALQLIHDVEVLEIAGVAGADELNAVYGLRDSLVRDLRGNLPNFINAAIAVDDDDPLPVGSTWEFYLQYCQAWNRVVRLFIQEGVGDAGTLWPWFEVVDEAQVKTWRAATRIAVGDEPDSTQTRRPTGESEPAEPADGADAP